MVRDETELRSVSVQSALELPSQEAPSGNVLLINVISSDSIQRQRVCGLTGFGDDDAVVMKFKTEEI